MVYFSTEREGSWDDLRLLTILCRGPYGAVYRTSFFFFQAEDGIRDLTVTGVQTCALPIWSDRFARRTVPGRGDLHRQLDQGEDGQQRARDRGAPGTCARVGLGRRQLAERDRKSVV